MGLDLLTGEAKSTQGQVRLWIEQVSAAAGEVAVHALAFDQVLTPLGTILVNGCIGRASLASSTSVFSNFEKCLCEVTD